MIKFSKSTKINMALYDRGLFSYRDILLYLPYKYEDFHLTKETNLNHHDRIVIYGQIIGSLRINRFRKNASLISFTFKTINNNIFYVEAWNRAYLYDHIKEDEFYTLSANYDKEKNKLNLTNIFKGQIEEDKIVKPIYSLPSCILNYQFQKYVSNAFKEVDKNTLYNEVPRYFMVKYRLLDKLDALKLIHFPKDLKESYEGFRVLKYEECLLFSLKSQLIRLENKELKKEDNPLIDVDKVKEFINSLSYNLTLDQNHVIKEIIDDLNAPSLMYRLLQGDVGTGKTLVAAIALYANFLRNDQGALMAPTDSLARQHYKTLKELFKGTNIKVGLLLGSMKVAQRALIRKALINKEIDIIVGTHVLFSEDINYLSLGLAIIDEQHKFGVNQRLHLASKGSRADLLLMSATPIPRTLALTLYGDLDVSTLTSFPHKKRDVKTQIVKRKEHVILNEIKDSLAKGKRIFIVAPRIGNSDDKLFSAESLFEAYNRMFPSFVGLVHGKLDADDKMIAIDDFITGKTPILIATSVIEVGIDVSNANLMIIYHPESFGLSSLHQLRGRVGRDGEPSKCLLVYDEDDPDEIEKLQILVDSNDGFYLAEQDLKRRGPGQLGGLKQSGVAGFNYVNLVSDFKMFESARKDAQFIIENKDQVGFRHILNRAKREIEKTNFTNV